MAELEGLLVEHAADRMIIFTNDNETVYRIAQDFLVPAITHRTPIRERKELLDGLREGRYRALATSRVLNEGVDIPEANVAVVMSGSASVREHVQRLGRILRRAQGKRAVLYELVAEDTMESFVSERRREHDAYR
jgi:superfamily II DNA or RNA helicase